MTFKLSKEDKDKILKDLEYKNLSIRRDIENYIEKSGAEGIVVGVSGGVDSALTLAICADVLGSKNVLGVMMPYSEELHKENMNDAMELCIQYGVRFTSVDIGDMVDAVAEGVRWVSVERDNVAYEIHDKDYDDILLGNIMARTRMIVLYHYAWLNNYLVAGTSNKSESYTGYFTKWGDGSTDFETIGMLLKTEVRELAKLYHVPQKIIDKVPSGNLWLGQTDEDQLGFTYDELDYMIYHMERLGRILNRWNDPKMSYTIKPIIEKVGWDRFQKLESIIKKTEHKRSTIPIMGAWGVFNK